jgi:SAM-dependent methyltransferase
MEIEEYERMFSVEDRHWWYVALHGLITRIVADEHRRKGRLTMLDAGCGTGRLCQLLARFGTVTGCDREAEAISRGYSRGLRNLLLVDLLHADLGNACFDVITSIDVLYHRGIPDEKAIMRKFTAALRPGGMLIVNVPAFEFLRSEHDRQVHTRKRYTCRELRSLFEGAGLTVTKATYRVAILFPVIAAYRLLWRRGNRHGPESHSDVWLPPQWANSLLRRIMEMENSLLRYGSLPFGTSVFAVGRKPPAAQHCG